MTTEKYDPQAEGWTEEAYADPSGYLAHRADLIVSVGPALHAGDTVLDLACGDAGLAEPLLAQGLRYVGVDLSGPMVQAARRRMGDRAEIVLADLNAYRPPAHVACTTCFRAVYYARDRRAFFHHVAGYTERKLIFDLNPRQYRVEDVVADLKAAGLATRGAACVLLPPAARPGPAARRHASCRRALGPARPRAAPRPLQLSRQREPRRMTS